MNLAARIWKSTIGRKVIMAVTGVILFGFVIGHLLGNLQIFIPDQGAKLNAYGRFLHENQGLLWTARMVLLVSVILHIWAAISLTLTNRKARPVPYVNKDYREASYSSRTMMLSGPIIALFVIYHLLHFTTGTFHPNPKPLEGADGAWNVYHNVTDAFNGNTPIRIAAAVSYVLAMILLGLHMNHGGWSMFQTLGINHPKYTPWIKKGMTAVAIFVTLGNISIPVACMLGFFK